MSRFFVGQRVRVARGVWDSEGQSPVGAEGRIAGERPLCRDLNGGLCSNEWLVVLDSGAMIGGDSEHLEPILPEGQVAITLEQLIQSPLLQGFGLERILEHIS